MPLDASLATDQQQAPAGGMHAGERHSATPHGRSQSPLSPRQPLTQQKQRQHQQWSLRGSGYAARVRMGSSTPLTDAVRSLIAATPPGSPRAAQPPSLRISSPCVSPWDGSVTMPPLGASCDPTERTRSPAAVASAVTRMLQSPSPAPPSRASPRVRVGGASAPDPYSPRTGASPRGSPSYTSMQHARRGSAAASPSPSPRASQQLLQQQAGESSQAVGDSSCDFAAAPGAPEGAQGEVQRSIAHAAAAAMHPPLPPPPGEPTASAATPRTPGRSTTTAGSSGTVAAAAAARGARSLSFPGSPRMPSGSGADNGAPPDAPAVVVAEQPEKPPKAAVAVAVVGVSKPTRAAAVTVVTADAPYAQPRPLLPIHRGIRASEQHTRRSTRTASFKVLYCTVRPYITLTVQHHHL